MKSYCFSPESLFVIIVDNRMIISSTSLTTLSGTWRWYDFHLPQCLTSLLIPWYDPLSGSSFGQVIHSRILAIRYFYLSVQYVRVLDWACNTFQNLDNSLLLLVRPIACLNFRNNLYLMIYLEEFYVTTLDCKLHSYPLNQLEFHITHTPSIDLWVFWVGSHCRFRN